MATIPEWLVERLKELGGAGLDFAKAAPENAKSFSSGIASGLFGDNPERAAAGIASIAPPGLPVLGSRAQNFSDDADYETMKNALIQRKSELQNKAPVTAFGGLLAPSIAQALLTKTANPQIVNAAKTLMSPKASLTQAVAPAIGEDVDTMENAAALGLAPTVAGKALGGVAQKAGVVPRKFSEWWLRNRVNSPEQMQDVIGSYLERPKQTRGAFPVQSPYGEDLTDMTVGRLKKVGDEASALSDKSLQALRDQGTHLTHREVLDSLEDQIRSIKRSPDYSETQSEELSKLIQKYNRIAANPGNVKVGPTYSATMPTGKFRKVPPIEGEPIPQDLVATPRKAEPTQWADESQMLDYQFPNKPVPYKGMLEPQMPMPQKPAAPGAAPGKEGDVLEEIMRDVKFRERGLGPDQLKALLKKEGKYVADAWGQDVTQGAKEGIKGFRSAIDKAVKGKNEQYRQIMEQVQPKASLLGQAKKAGWDLSDMDLNPEKLQASIAGPLRSMSFGKTPPGGQAGVIRQLDELTGGGLQQKIKDRQILNTFLKDTSRGSRDTQAAGAVGDILGEAAKNTAISGVLGPAGKIAGRMRDAGGKAAMSALDVESWLKRFPKERHDVLRSALEKGGVQSMLTTGAALDKKSGGGKVVELEDAPADAPIGRVVELE